MAASPRRTSPWAYLRIGRWTRFRTHPFAPATFNMITSVAALHHMDARAALDRMSQLLAPGGRLAIVGLARTVTPPLTSQNG
jgi:SAM-dependent methyltransferase